MLCLLLAVDDNSVTSHESSALYKTASLYSAPADLHTFPVALHSSHNKWQFFKEICGTFANAGAGLMLFFLGMSVIHTLIHHINAPSALCANPTEVRWPYAKKHCGEPYSILSFDRGREINETVFSQEWPNDTELTYSDKEYEKYYEVGPIRWGCKRYAQCRYYTPRMFYSMDCKGPCRN